MNLSTTPSPSCTGLNRIQRLLVLAGTSVITIASVPSLGSVTTTPTTDPDTLRAALNPVGLSIDSVSIHNGVAGQFGTFTNFETLPVTIRPGVVLSSGNVTNLSPIPGATDPDYDPASPPEQVNNQMTPEPDSGGTPEFDAYGGTSGNIENFNASFDVAAMRVDFQLDEDSQVKFDFLFGSVEFPYWTGQFTDSFLVFLDGTTPAHQITLDAAGNAVQVGSSFAGLETTGDLNTAFSEPHALIHHLTTTTARLDAGDHFLIFEIGDVNDHILDSAVFIANLRAETGNEGTEPSDDPPHAGCPYFTNEPEPIAGCSADSATFTVTAAGSPPLSYQWYHDNVPLDTLNNPSAATTTLTLNSLHAGDAGIYHCIVTNSCNSERSDRVELTLCLGDADCDGDTDSDDIIVFFGAWDIGELQADVDGDSDTDSDDVIVFFTSWDAGC